MSGNTMKSRLLASSVFAGVAFMASASMLATAQEADDAETVTTTEDAESVQSTVYVTGSRIAQPNLVTTSPVSSVSSQDIKLQGVTRVEDLVVQLPQAFAAQNSTVANGASGTATVSLRNLGSTRTLVLIDGKRMPYGSPNDPAADLNLIPGQLVERVDVLTGGASAVYGSDAVSGVVNFIMKKEFEGVQVDAQYGFFNHKNDYDTNGNLRDVIAGRAVTNPAQFQLPEDDVSLGYSKEITAILGMRTDDDRGGVQGYVSYRNNDDVLQAFYDYSACSIGGATATGFTCGGSGTASPARFTDFGLNTGFNLTIDRVSGAIRPFSNATDQYNFGPLNYYQRPDERYSAGFFGDYEINPYVNAYTSFMFMDYSSVAQIAPSGNFFSTPTINCGNPLIPVAMRPTIGCDAANIAGDVSVPFYIGRRNTEGGGRQDNLGYQTYRGVIGIKGPLMGADAWEYDLSAQFSQVTLARSYQNDFSASRLARAVDVVSVGGVPTCRSVVNGSDPNCVPYNPFVNGGIDQAQLDYLQVPLLQNGTTEQAVVIASLTGDLGQYGWKMPTAESGLKVAGGVEYRRDAIDQIVDNAFATGDGAGQGGPTLPLSGEIDNYDIFGEFQFPLVEGRPGIELLSLDGAYRYSTYSTGISSDSWKVGTEYAPSSDIRFRGSFQKAVRAPNVIDLFQSQGLGLFDLDDDPCDFTDPNGDGVASNAACIGTAPHQTTLAAANGGFLTSPAGQYNNFNGGEPNLNPEEAETFTVGFVATPSFIPGLNLSLDYYDIEITEAISVVGGSVTVDLCYFQNDAPACSLITRNAAGNLWTSGAQVVDLNKNIGGISTSGYDLAGSYSFEAGKLGGINLSYNGTRLDSFDVDPVGNPSFAYGCVGAYGNDCGTPTPEYRHRARFGWSTPVDGLELNATWRHIGEVALDSGVTTRVDSVLEAQDYLDLAGTWAANDWAAFRFGVNNVLDDDPPLSASVGTTGNGNTYPQSYDALGRYVFVGVTLDF